MQAYTKELRRYFKYMFNDHLLFVLIFGGGAAIYYYSQWVNTLTSGFPVGIIMAVVLGLICSQQARFIHLLKEADIVFLLPLETKLMEIFQERDSIEFLEPILHYITMC